MAAVLGSSSEQGRLPDRPEAEARVGAGRDNIEVLTRPARFVNASRVRTRAVQVDAARQEERVVDLGWRGTKRPGGLVGEQPSSRGSRRPCVCVPLPPSAPRRCAAAAPALPVRSDQRSACRPGRCLISSEQPSSATARQLGLCKAEGGGRRRGAHGRPILFDPCAHSAHPRRGAQEPAAPPAARTTSRPLYDRVLQHAVQSPRGTVGPASPAASHARTELLRTALRYARTPPSINNLANSLPPLGQRAEAEAAIASRCGSIPATRRPG